LARKIHLNPWRTDVKTREFSQVSGSSQQYEVDFSSVATERGTTVSSVTWTDQSGGQIVFATQSLTDGVAAADINSETWSPTAQGVRIEATYADGATERAYFTIKFKQLGRRA